jgi:hypothetical protein
VRAGDGGTWRYGDEEIRIMNLIYVWENIGFYFATF